MRHFFFQIGESGATEIPNTNLRRSIDALIPLQQKKELPIGSINDAFQKLGDAAWLMAGYKATKFLEGALALSTQETIKTLLHNQH